MTVREVIRGKVGGPSLALRILTFLFLSAAPAIAWAENTVRQPPGAAVVVERILSTDADLGRGGLVRFLTGRGVQGLFVRPHGVAWEGESLFVTDPGAGTVIRVRGKKIRKCSAGLFESPIGVASCPAGIVVSDSHLGRVGLLNRELDLVRWLAEGLNRPTGVACEGDRIFVAETGEHRVVVISARGEDAAGAEVVATFGSRGSEPGTFNFPTTVASAGGGLWVGDTLNFRVQRFDLKTLAFDSAFGRLGDAAGEMPRVKGMALDSAGRIWITDAHLDQIALYSRNGDYLASFGGRGSGQLQFDLVAGIDVSENGRIAVADALNRRVHILRLEE